MINQQVYAAAAGGIVLGGSVVYLITTNKYKKDLAFQAETIRNAYEIALNEKERDRVVVVESIEVPVDDISAKIVESIDAEVSLSAKIPNPYHTAVQSVLEKPVLVNPGDTTDYAISYITEDDFRDDDGRNKNQMDMMLGEGVPVFLLNGVEEKNWEDHVGGSIVVEMHNRQPIGTDGVLYVRNNRTEEDYEVVRVMP